MRLRWLMQMRRWVTHPPGARRIMLVAVIVGACLLLVALERAGLLPDWMTAERVRILR